MSRRHPNKRSSPAGRVDIRESGIVPATHRVRDALQPALTLAGPDDVAHFGASIAGAADVLLVGGQLDARQPFAALYRLTSRGAMRTRWLRGAEGHRGPRLATDGTHVVVGQPAAKAGHAAGFASIYRLHEGTLSLEATFTDAGDGAHDFGELAAVGRDLVVVGHAASLCVYRHSEIGWLSAGQLKPPLSYAWNPELGRGLAAGQGRIIVGNPIELQGHRAGPGRAFVYRQKSDRLELENVLRGDGIEGGRLEPARRGFGASIHIGEEFVLITAPHELSSDGTSSGRVYVYRSQNGLLTRVACVPVPSCQGGACVVGDRLCVLGDALYVFARRGLAFEELATYPVAHSESATISACGRLVGLSNASAVGEVTLYFPARL